MRIDSSNVQLKVNVSEKNNKIIGHKKENIKKEQEEKSNKIKIEAKALKKKKEKNYNKLIKQLEDIREQLKKQKNDLKNPKTMNFDNLPFDKLAKEEQEQILKQRKEKIKILEEKIEEINEQIQQLELQKQKAKVEEDQEELEDKKKEIKNKRLENEKQDIVVDESLYNLIEAIKSTDTISSLKQIKTSEKLESMFIPKGRDENSYDSKRLKQIARSAARIDSNVQSSIRKMNRKVKQVRNENELIKFKENSENIKIDEKLEKGIKDSTYEKENSKEKDNNK